MSQLEEEILKQNVLEEHRQVHELQVRIKELRGDITRYMMINAELLRDLETARAELAAAREQEPVAFAKYKETGGNIGLSWVGVPTGAFYPRELEPLYARPIPAPAPAVPTEWRGEWEHTKGGKYRVLMLTNEATTDPRYPLMVVYQGQDGNIWTRPAHDWHRSMTLLKPAGEKS